MKYIFAFLTAFIFFVIQLITLSSYGINWDSPNHMLRGQALAQLYLTGKRTYDIPQKTSPIFISPNEYASRFYFTPSENGKKVQLQPNLHLKNDFDVYQTNNALHTSFYEDEAWNGTVYGSNETGGHLPLIDTLAAISNRIFYQQFNILGDIESYQLIYIFFSSLGIFVVFLFTYEILESKGHHPIYVIPGSSAVLSSLSKDLTRNPLTIKQEIPDQVRDDKMPKESGRGQNDRISIHAFIPALIASLCLALYPAFFAEAHFNMKDPIQASFFAGAVWSFWHYVKTSKKRWLVLLALFVAFALGVKWNIVFLPFILIPWLFLIRRSPEFKSWFKFKKLLISFVLLLLSCFLFLVLIWPTAWPNPLQLFNVANFYIDFGQRLAPFEPIGYILPLGINIYPLLLLITQTPEVTLLLLGLGLLSIVIPGSSAVLSSLSKDLTRNPLTIKQEIPDQVRDDKKTLYLLLFWLLVPIVRLLVPHAGFYGGIRQFMEILPAMAIIAGLGFIVMLNLFQHLFISWKIPKRVRDDIFPYVLFLISFFFLLIPILRLHPNENAYFNLLTGGINGAAQNNLVDWSLTFGNVYKQGANWLNSNAQKDAKLAHLDGSNFAISPLWLRDDVSFSPDNFSGFSQKGEYLMALYNPLDPPAFASRYPRKFLRPVHTITADGFPLLFIYQNSPKYSLVDLSKRQFITGVIQPYKGSPSDYLGVDLGKDLKIIQVAIQAPNSCLKAPDDIIELVPQALSMHTQNPDQTFYVQEKKDLGNGQVAFYFPAETARYIYILPQSKNSCFINTRVALVSFLL